MANLHGDDEVVIDSGDGYRIGNSLLISEVSEMEAEKNTHSEAIESKQGRKRVNSSALAEEAVCDLEEGQQKKKVKKAHDCGDGRSFFDCNICLEMAREPVVTYCGHLFCWACFYKVRYVNSSAKTKACPVCRGEVTDSSIIPIFGNGVSIEECDLESGTGMTIPPRPKGQRAERAMQPVPGEALQAQDRVGGNRGSRPRHRTRYVPGRLLFFAFNNLFNRRRKFYSSGLVLLWNMELC